MKCSRTRRTQSEGKKRRTWSWQSFLSAFYWGWAWMPGDSVLGLVVWALGEPFQNWELDRKTVHNNGKLMQSTLLQAFKPLTWPRDWDLTCLSIIKLILKKYKSIFLKENFKSESKCVWKRPHLFLTVKIIWNQNENITFIRWNIIQYLATRWQYKCIFTDAGSCE